MIKLFFTLAAVFSLQFSFAQNKYKQVDDFVKKLGDLKELNVARIADTLTSGIADDQLKLRAIYYWIANNISLDVKATKNADNRPVLPETVIEKRISSAQGFATLFQEMSSSVNIRCLSVDGFFKRRFEDLEEIPDEVNHSWNVVQLGQSSDKWFYVDVAAAAGSLDEPMKVFEKHFTSDLFFADKPFFNLTHFPDNSAWQLGPGPKSKKSFYDLPVIETAAVDFGISEFLPKEGKPKTNVKKGLSFSFTYDGITPIEKVELIIGNSRKPTPPVVMDFTASGNKISFTHKFKESDSYPTKVLVNGKLLFKYLVEVKE